MTTLNLEPHEIIAVCNIQKQRTDAIRQKWIRTYELFTGRYYKGVSTVKGSYRTYVSNKPMTFGNKIVELLSSMDMFLRIPLLKQPKKGRQGISDVEAFGYGIQDLADQRLVMVGEKRIGDALAFNIPIFGCAFIFEFVHKDEDLEGNEITVPDIKIWDAPNTYWFMGKRGLRWIAHSRVADVDSTRDEYGDDTISEDVPDTGQCTLYDVWDDNTEKVLVNDKKLHEEKHGLGYVPVRFQQCGSVPYIQIPGYDDTIKDSFKSIYDSNYNGVYESFSEAMSYGLDIMSKESKTPMVVLAEGGAKALKLPDEDPMVAGGFMVLDSQKVKTPPVPLMKPGIAQSITEMISLFAREISNGSWADIAYGMFDSAAPVGTTNMMLRTAMSVLMSSQKAIEESRTWIVNEAINQYKKGDFNPLRLHGEYTSNRYYDVEVTPDKIDDQWKLECKLRLNPPQDELTNVNIASQARDRGLLSTETIQDKYLMVQDTDAENQKMALERAIRNPVVEMTNQIDALIADDKEGHANAISMLMAMREDIINQYKLKLLNPQIQGGMGNQGEQPQGAGLTPQIPGGTPPVPSRTATNQNMGSQGMNEEVPPEVRKDAQKVLV